MADEKPKSNDLDLDVKKTALTGELAEDDLNKVAGGQVPLRTITCDEECDSYQCMDTYC